MVYTCVCCQYSTVNKRTYEDHLTSKKHQKVASDQAEYKCDKCHKPFTTPSGLRKHRPRCRCNSTTDASNAIISVDLGSQALLEIVKQKMRAELRAEIQAELLAEFRTVIRSQIRAIFDSSNILTMLQPFFNPIRSNVSTGSHSLVAHDINSHSFNNTSSFQNQLNMFLGAGNSMPNITNYSDIVSLDDVDPLPPRSWKGPTGNSPDKSSSVYNLSIWIFRYIHIDI